MLHLKLMAQRSGRGMVGKENAGRDAERGMGGGASSRGRRVAVVR